MERARRCYRVDDALLDPPPLVEDSRTLPPHPTTVSTSDSEVDAARKSPPEVVFKEAIQITSRCGGTG